MKQNIYENVTLKNGTHDDKNRLLEIIWVMMSRITLNEARCKHLYDYSFKLKITKLFMNIWSPHESNAGELFASAYLCFP